MSDIQSLQNLQTPAILILYPQQQNSEGCHASSNGSVNNDNTQYENPNPYDVLKDASSIPIITVSSTVKDQDPVARERIHICQYPNCNKTYFKNSHLKTHIRTHTGQYFFTV